jgi:hypothetical protein
LCGRILEYIDVEGIIPSHQFGFKRKHSTTQQLQRVVDYIAVGLEEKLYTTGVFLDIASAFDCVWHEGLLFKLKSILPDTFFRIMQSYLKNRYFKVRHGQAFSTLKEIRAGVPQGAILSPILYNIYTSDLPLSDDTMTATYADDTLLLAQDHSHTEATDKLQSQLYRIEDWLKKWRVKVNTAKSVHVTFTLRRQMCPPTFLNREQIPQNTQVKYLGLWLDQRLTWKYHLKVKRIQLNARLKALYWIVRKKSKLCLRQKLLLYKSLIRPLWTYGLELFGTSARSNLRTLESLQSKFLRLAVGAPWYVNNRTLHDDLKIETVQEMANQAYQNFHRSLHDHPNPLAAQLANRNVPLRRRLRRSWSRDLLQ